MMNRSERLDAMERHVEEAEKILIGFPSVLEATKAAAHAVLAVFYRLDVHADDANEVG